MMKKLVASGFVLFVLCAPALADSVVSPLPAPQGSQPVRLELSVKVGTQVRKHDLVLVDQDCGEVVDKGRDHQDEIRLCLGAGSGKDVRLSIDWRTAEGDAELHTRSGALFVRGTTFELGGGTMRLSIASK